jgi:hypothetical protein
MNMNMMLLGVIVALAGVILMILGKLWAVLLLLAGAGLVIAHWAKLFKGAGYRAEGAFYNGPDGTGRQQSEVSKDPTIPQDYEDRPANK